MKPMVHFAFIAFLLALLSTQTIISATKMQSTSQQVLQVPSLNIAPEDPTRIVAQLVGATPDAQGWTDLADAAIKTSLFDGRTFIGPYGQGQGLRRVLTNLPTLRSITIRFRLYAQGDWAGEQFRVVATGNQTVLTQQLTQNGTANIEFSFNYTQTALNLTFTSDLPANKANTTWGISDFVIYYNRCPAGQLVNYIPPVCADLSAEQAGNVINILINSTFRGVLPGEKNANLLWNNLEATLPYDRSRVVVQLTGNTLNTQGWTDLDLKPAKNTTYGDTNIVGPYTFVNSQREGLRRTFGNLPVHQSVTVRFRLYTIDNWDGAGSNDFFYIFADGSNMYSQAFAWNAPGRKNVFGDINWSSGLDGTEDIEITFAHTRDDLHLVLTSNIDADESWGVSDFAIYFNTCPNGQLYDRKTRQCNPITSAQNGTIILHLANTIYGGTLPGSEGTGLAWNNFQESDRLAVFFADGTTNANGWFDFNRAVPRFNSFEGRTFVGNFGSGEGIRGAFSDLPPHQSVTVRFRLYTLDSWESETFFLEVDGSNVFSQTFSWNNAGRRNVWGSPSFDQGRDGSDDIEVTFAHTNNTIIFRLYSNLNQVASDESWGVSDFIAYYNRCPAGQFFNGDACVAYANATRGMLIYDLIENVHGGIYPKSRLLWNAFDFYNPNRITVQLSGPNPNVAGWTDLDGRTPKVDVYNNRTFIGNYGRNEGLKRTFTNLPRHQTVHIRFRLYSLDSWENETFRVEADRNIAYVTTFDVRDSERLRAWGRPEWADATRDVEFSIVHNASTLDLQFTSTLNETLDNESWGISDFVIFFSRCPLGQTYNETGAGCVRLGPDQNSLILQVLDRTYGGSVPGEQNRQLAWNARDFYNNRRFITQLTGNITNRQGWLDFNGNPSKIFALNYNKQILGLYGNAEGLSRSFENIPPHNSITIRFRLYIVDSWENEFFFALADNTEIYRKRYYQTSGDRANIAYGSTNDLIEDVEITFAHTTNTLNLRLSSTLDQVWWDEAWGISDFVIYFNRCPANQLFDQRTNQCTPQNVDSIIFSIIDNVFGGTFPGEQNTQFAWNTLPETERTIVQFTGPNINTTGWVDQSGSSTIRTDFIEGRAFAGTYGVSEFLRRTFTQLPRHRSVSIRFRLYTIDTWENERFFVEADGVTVFNEVFSVNSPGRLNVYGNGAADGFMDVEVAFNHTGSLLNLLFNHNLNEARTDESWGVSDFVIYFNRCPAGQVYNQATNQCTIVRDGDRNTAILNLIDTVYAGVYTTTTNLQLLWNQNDIYSPNRAIAQLTGPTPNVEGWLDLNNNPLRIGAYQGRTFIGNYGKGEGLTRTFTRLPVHLSVSVRFRIYSLDSWTGERFNVFADNNVAFNTSFHVNDPERRRAWGTAVVPDATRDVEFAFNHTANTLQLLINTTLNDNITLESWGISDFVIYFNRCPAGFIYDRDRTRCVTLAERQGVSVILDFIDVALAGSFPGELNRDLLWNTRDSYGPNRFIVQVTGANPDLRGWRDFRGEAPRTNKIDQKLFIGAYGNAEGVYRIFENLPTHNSITVRFRLYVIDSWENEFFNMTADGISVYTKRFHANDIERSQIYYASTPDGVEDVEVSFTHTASTLNLRLFSNLDQVWWDESWGFSDFVIYFNRCPAGQLYDERVNLCVTQNSDTLIAYIIDNFYKGVVPGAENSQLPWNAVPETQRVLMQLTNPTFNTTGWVDPASSTLRTGIFDGRTFLGTYGINENIRRNFNQLPRHRSVSIRFRVYAIDSWENEKFYLEANGVNVVSETFMWNTFGRQNVLGGSAWDGFRDVEVSFNHSIPNLNLRFYAGLDQPRDDESWGISDFVIYFNRCPAGQVYNQANNQCETAKSGLRDTPILNLIDNVFGGVYLNNETLSSPWIQDDHYRPNRAIAQFVGRNPDVEGWADLLNKSVKTGVYQGRTFIGNYGKNEGIRRDFTQLPQHTSVSVRFRIYSLDSWIGRNLTVYSGDQLVFTTLFNNSDPERNFVWGGRTTADATRDVEFAFNHTDSRLSLRILSNLNLTKSASSWGISDLVIYFNRCPAGTIYDRDRLYCVETIRKPNTTVILDFINIAYGGTYPGERNKQLLWNTVDVNETSRLRIQIVGASPDVQGWADFTGVIPKNVSVEGRFVLGQFGNGEGLTRSFEGLPVHNSITFRFRLYSFDTWENEFFNMTADGVTVYTKRFNAQDPERANMHYQSTADGAEDVEVTIAHTATTLNLRLFSNLDQVWWDESWGISDFVIYFNRCPVGQLFNETTRECTVQRPNSVILYLIDTLYGGVVPGEQNAQLVWNSVPETQRAIVQLAGSNFNMTKWLNQDWNAVSRTSTFTGRPFLGNFGINEQLRRSFTQIPRHQSVSIRFRLYTLDTWESHSFYLELDGNVIYRESFHWNNAGRLNVWGNLGWSAGTDGFRDVEVAVNHTLSTLNLRMRADLDENRDDESWGISDFAIYFNRCPAGQTFNQTANQCRPVVDGNRGLAILSLIDNAYGGVYAGDGVLDLLWNQNDFYNPDRAVAQFTGPRLNVDGWSDLSNRLPRTGVYEGRTYVGKYGRGESLRRNLTNIPQHSSVSVRFRLYALDGWDNDTFVVRGDNQPVFTLRLTENNTVTRDVEFAFNHTDSRLLLDFTSTLNDRIENEAWGISDLFIYYSRCPAGFIYDRDRIRCVNTAERPDTTVILNTLDITYGIGYFGDQYQQLLWTPRDFYTPNRIQVQLTGTNLDTLGWTEFNGRTSRTAKLEGGKSFLGSFGNGEGLIRNYANLVTHNSITIRFRLYSFDTWENEFFNITADGVSVYTKKFNVQDPERSNIYYQSTGDGIEDVEITFAHNVSTLNLRLFSNLDQVWWDESWGISDWVIYFNRCPVDQLFDDVAGRCIPQNLPSEILYLIDNIYGGVVPGEQNAQLVWNAVPETQSAIALLASPTVDFKGWLDQNMNTISRNSTFLGRPFIGNFGINEQLRRSFVQVPRHQSLSIRFRLYILDTWESHSFYLDLDGNNIYRESFHWNNPGRMNVWGNLGWTAGTDGFRDVEVSVNHTGALLNLRMRTDLDENRDDESWGISDFVIYFNKCPAGLIFNNGACLNPPSQNVTPILSLIRTAHNGIFANAPALLWNNPYTIVSFFQHPENVIQSPTLIQQSTNLKKASTLKKKLTHKKRSSN